ncbi:MAG: hypothetical protein ACM4AI_09800 [Acidobacteriota bacterium]
MHARRPGRAGGFTTGYMLHYAARFPRQVPTSLIANLAHVQ